MNIGRKKIGLALGSGGVKGIAHIGVLRVLAENNIPVDFIAGTSIGSLIAAHYALFKDIKSLEEILFGQRKEKLISLLEPSLKGGLIKGRKVEALLHRWINDAEFKDTKVPLKIVSTDLISGQEVVFSEGRIVPAIRASLAVPTLFEPYLFEDKVLVDGGLCNPVPDDLVKAMGADIVISVNLDNYSRNGITNYKALNLAKAARRSLDIMRYNLARYSNKHSDIILKPEVHIIGLRGWRKYFTSDIAQQIMDTGIKETEKMIPVIKKLL